MLDAEILQEVEDLGHHPKRSKTVPKNEMVLRKKIVKQWKKLSEQTQEKLNALKHNAEQPIDLDAEILKEVDKLKRYPQYLNKLDLKDAREEHALRKRIDRQWEKFSEET